MIIKINKHKIKNKIIIQKKRKKRIILLIKMWNYLKQMNTKIINKKFKLMKMKEK